MDGWDFLKIFSKSMELLMSFLPTWKHIKWFCIGVFALGLAASIILSLIVDIKYLLS